MMNLSNKKYLITGGAGFIGSNVVETLNNRGDNNIIIVDSMGSGEKWKNLVDLQFIDYWEKDKFLCLHPIIKVL